jgi:hypothetical protein
MLILRQCSVLFFYPGALRRNERAKNELMVIQVCRSPSTDQPLA